VAFQIIERQPITTTTFPVVVQPKPQPDHNGPPGGQGGYIDETTIIPDGPAELPDPNEAGWKDTFIVPPGYVGRVVAKFDRPGRYVWHCHILSHEDHEMMRPYYVNPFPAPIVAEETTEQAFPLFEPALVSQYPNPFSSGTNISFYLPGEENVVLNVYDLNGKIVKQLASGLLDAGNHTIEWDGMSNGGQQLPDGLYIYQLQAGETLLSDQIIIQR
jgi:spore coat protein A